MQALVTGIGNHFSQQVAEAYHPFYTAIGGRLRDGVAWPEDGEEDQAILSLPDDLPASMMRNKRNEILVQFDLYSWSTNSAVIGGIYDNLEDWFDDCEAAKGSWAALSVSGYRVQLVDRAGTFRFSPDMSPGEEEAYWRYVARYLVTLLKL